MGAPQIKRSVSNLSDSTQFPITPYNMTPQQTAIPISSSSMIIEPLIEPIPLAEQKRRKTLKLKRAASQSSSNDDNKKISSGNNTSSTNNAIVTTTNTGNTKNNGSLVSPVTGDTSDEGQKNVEIDELIFETFCSD